MLKTFKFFVNFGTFITTKIFIKDTSFDIYYFFIFTFIHGRSLLRQVTVSSGIKLDNMFLTVLLMR